VEQVVGVGRTAAPLQRARELGIIDLAASSVEEALRDADLVLIAAPVAQTGKNSGGNRAVFAVIDIGDRCRQHQR